MVPLSPGAREVFGELLRGAESSGAERIRSTGRSWLWEQVARAAHLAGLDAEKCRPYALRHTFATHLLERGVPWRDVAALMGHSDPRSLMGYTVPSDDRLRRAVEALG